ncbi:hypothetical protein A2U01_0029508, partial [Trifolium medium]|nr:hypothetical protein [Trifolium medium]
MCSGCGYSKTPSWSSLRQAAVLCPSRQEMVCEWRGHTNE